MICLSSNSASSCPCCLYPHISICLAVYFLLWIEALRIFLWTLFNRAKDFTTSIHWITSKLLHCKQHKYIFGLKNGFRQNGLLNLDCKPAWSPSFKSCFLRGDFFFSLFIPDVKTINFVLISFWESRFGSILLLYLSAFCFVQVWLVGRNWLRRPSAVILALNISEGSKEKILLLTKASDRPN